MWRMRSRLSTIANFLIIDCPDRRIGSTSRPFIGQSRLVSVFAGRIADTGRDPIPLMLAAVELLRPAPSAELSSPNPRELLNIFQADAIGCHIVTVTDDVLRKIPFIGKDLEEYSLVTVRMFCQDAHQAGYTLYAVGFIFVLVCLMCVALIHERSESSGSGLCFWRL
jgi:hypothetical protein